MSLVDAYEVLIVGAGRAGQALGRHRDREAANLNPLDLPCSLVGQDLRQELVQGQLPGHPAGPLAWRGR
jgi:hypothetical protein